MFVKVLVVFKPPRSHLRENKELLSTSPQDFQLSNRFIAISRVITSIQSFFRLRKVRSLVAVKVQKVAIAFTYYYYSRIFRNDATHDPFHFSNLLTVGHLRL